MKNPMQAMLFDQPHHPLRQATIPRPKPGPGQVLLKVRACGVCRTDLHIIDGDLKNPAAPLAPGHEIIGTVEAVGEGVERFTPGARVGVPWLGFTCGECVQCRAARENLCPSARFTGYQIQGGYCEYTVADHRYCFLIHGDYGDAEAAPLLCAGLIGYRSLRKAGDPARRC
jgi:alcohol dehydrogenase, propanol-preferring